MSEYKPPFHTTDKITNLVAAISEQIGRIKVLSHGNLNPHLLGGKLFYQEDDRKLQNALVSVA